MSTITFNLASQLGTGSGSDFTTQFPLIDLGDSPKGWELALLSADLWNSVANISATRGNNTWRYYNGAEWSANQIIPDGVYSLSDLNAEIQGAITNTNIALSANYITLKCDITLLNAYQLDLSIGRLHSVLGFTSKIVTATESGTSNVDITDGIDSWQIRCSLVDPSTSFSGSSGSDVLYSFSPFKSSGELMNLSPPHLIFSRVNTTHIQSIRVYLTDQVGNALDLRGENSRITIVVRSV